MKYYKLTPYLLALLLFTLGACEDDEATDADTTAPVITITSPQDGATIQTPGPVTISGSIVEAGQLERIEVVVSTQGFPLYTETLNRGDAGFPTKSGDTYAINVTQQIDQDVQGSFRIDIEAEDAEGNIGNEDITVTLQ